MMLTVSDRNALASDGSCPICRDTYLPPPLPCLEYGGEVKNSAFFSAALRSSDPLKKRKWRQEIESTMRVISA